MPKLTSHLYGKARVRVAKLFRDKDRHSIKEIDVAAMLEGDFESSYTGGDNTKVVPTDTIKNTINVLANEKLSDEIELFAIGLAEHFLAKYKQVRAARIEISERDWRRMEIEGKPHPHSFAAGNDAVASERVVAGTATEGCRIVTLSTSKPSPRSDLTIASLSADRRR